jgi:dienelactone hydrolase
MLAEHFAAEVQRVQAGGLDGIDNAAAWRERRGQAREELREMLGLLPYPEKTDLNATVTGRLEQPEFFVEKLHFQSLPGLYVTANVYVPQQATGRVPAILYVCGHSRQADGNVSYGNKAGYQHHGAWFARHGYICLIVDTIQLGELEGLHHGTYREGMWWWNARGYTPVGVETWNAMRALDYLQSRPDVDGGKIGMTGRSGGGAYTWYTAALDERVKVAVPVAGITDLHNHVVDGGVAGHCDCMFPVNTHRWDYATLAALVAPRPLLIANSDKDAIFPLDGVVRVHRAVARIYALEQAGDKLGLLITEGPHKDTQDLQVPAFRWFNRFLKGEDPPIRVAAEKFFAPARLRVFAELPADERSTKAHEFFVPAAVAPVVGDAATWAAQRERWLRALREKSFGGWPATPAIPEVVRVAGEPVADPTVSAWEFVPQEKLRLPLVVRAAVPLADVKRVQVRIVDGAEWEQAKRALSAGTAGGDPATAIVLVPSREWLLRGMTPRDQVQQRRRYMLLGQTQDGMTVWDIGCAVAAVRSAVLFPGRPVELAGTGRQAVNALYAALFAEGVTAVELTAPPASHRYGPDYLNVLRYLDVPQALALAAERAPVTLKQANPDDWAWTAGVGRRLGWPAERLRW